MLRAEQAKRDDRLGVANASVGAVGSLNLATIFALNSSASTIQIFEATAGKVLLPIAAITSITEAIFSWANVHRAKNKAHPIIKALIDTVAAAGIVAAVVGTLVAPFLFTLAAPILYVAIFGAKTLFNFATAIYFKVKEHREADPILKSQYHTHANNSAMGAVIGLVATAASVGVFLLGKPVLAAIGIIAGVAAAIFAGVTIFKIAKKHKAEKSADYISLAVDDVDQSELGLNLDPNLDSVAKNDKVVNISPEEVALIKPMANNSEGVPSRFGMLGTLRRSQSLPDLVGHDHAVVRRLQ